MKLHAAYSLAEKIKTILVPYCDRVEIAGSIRRARSEPNDIDFVCLPKAGDLITLKERIRTKTRVTTDGDKQMTVKMKDGTQIDFFFAHHPTRDLLQPIPGNFGTILLIRTGSTAHNIFLIETAKRLGLELRPSVGVLDEDGRIIASETEEEIFKALGLEFVPPAYREK